MSDGQLAMNTNLVSPGLFLKDSNGDLVKVGPVHVGTTAPNATPGAGGQAGNSKGEQWLDTSSSRYVFKIWDGTAWRTEDGEFVNTSGDTMTGALVMDNQQQVRFRETTANGTNYIALQAPASVASDKTITLPDVTGTVVTTGDTGSVTSTMLLDGTILNADINASAAIVDTKLATISTAGKVSGTAITSGNIVTSGSFNTTGSILVDSSSPTIRLEESDGTATHNRTLLIRDGNAFSIRTRSSADASVSTDYIIDTNASGAESHSWRIANTEKARIDSSGRLGLGTISPATQLHIEGNPANITLRDTDAASNGYFQIGARGGAGDLAILDVDPNNVIANSVFAINVDNAERLRITAAGNVGIGTSSPAETLEVAGNAILDGSDANLKIKAGTTGTTGAVNFTFNTDSTVYGGLDLSYDNRATDGVRLFAAASNYPVTIQSHSGAHIAFRGSATERARIDSSGRLGLGVSSPTSLLHLADAGNITVGTTTGTKIGTATTQKLGFYNATPVVQPTAVADATTSVDVITQLNALLAKLRTLGIIAT